MKDIKPKTIDEYINSAPEESQGILHELIAILKETVPQVEGKISWNVPIYYHYGILAGFDVAKKHVSFGIDCLEASGMRKTLEEKSYKTGKKTIQIKFNQKVPKTEIIRLINEQAKLNEADRK